MQLDSIHWKPTYISPDYLVSDEGQVYSLKRQIMLKPERTSKGYYRYYLYSGGVDHKVKAHRLVAIAFIPRIEGKTQIDHINGIKTDNRVSNLRWATNKENCNNPVTLQRLRASRRAKI